MDNDGLILKVLKDAKRKNRKTLSVETISFLTGLRRQYINKRLRQMEKFEKVKVYSKKPVDFWGIIIEDFD